MKEYLEQDRIITECYVARDLQNGCHTRVGFSEMYYFWGIWRAPINIFEEPE